MAPGCAVWFWGKWRLPLSKKQRELSPGLAGGGFNAQSPPKRPQILLRIRAHAGIRPWLQLPRDGARLRAGI